LVGGVVAALALLVVAFVYLRTHDLTDLRVYRLGGQAVLDGTSLYDVRDRTGLAFTYPPFAALVFVPAALVPGDLAAQLGTIVAAAALGRSAWIVARLAVGHRPSAALVVGVVAAALVIEPVGSTFGLGQINLLVMWLVLEDVAGAVPARWRGVLTGLATGLKLTPALFVVYFAATRQWAAAARATATGAATVLVGLLVQPTSAWEFWTGTAYDSTRLGGVEHAGNQSVHGTIERLLGPDVPALGWMPVALAVAAFGIATAARLHRRGDELAALTAVAVTMLLVSPVSWNHHWVWVLLVIGLVVVPGQSPRVRAALVLVVLVFGSRLIWLAPYRDGAEFDVGLPGSGAQNAYVLVGLGLLAWLATTAFRPDETGPARDGRIDAAGDEPHQPEPKRA
jgi:alpha-1,2-mannosyltransferase